MISVQSTSDSLRLGRRRNRQPEIAVLHDFVLDHYVIFKSQLNKSLLQMRHVAARGGGNIVVGQYLVRGGKAANLASALARLGAKTHLIARTSGLGRQLAETLLRPAGVDTSCIRTDGTLALTVSLEIPIDGRLTNIMLSDPGSNADFSFSDIGRKGLMTIREADGVALTDWALNRKGTGLAEGVFKYVGREKLLLLDPGDVSRRPGDLRGLIDRVLRRGYGVLSINESEALCLAESLIGGRMGKGRDSPELRGLKAARELASELGIRVDLHTSLFSASFKDGHSYVSPTYRVEVRRVTGAGDSWNAGNMYAEWAGLSDEERLEFANALAAYYISHPSAQHPTRAEVEGFILSRRRRKRDLRRLGVRIQPITC
ncbi:carbohydrate kinase family protein [Candidatus Bathyarchaeota archaeon]|nr:carbohydrate kinase family protein [Candidatus Bathyarchaeota archaeon]